MMTLEKAKVDSLFMEGVFGFQTLGKLTQGSFSLSSPPPANGKLPWVHGKTHGSCYLILTGEWETSQRKASVSAPGRDGSVSSCDRVSIKGPFFKAVTQVNFSPRAIRCFLRFQFIIFSFLQK